MVKSTTNQKISAEEIKKINVLTDRVKKRRQEWEEAMPIVCPENSVSFTKSWKETEGLPVDLRWAYAFERRMNESPIIIKDGELIVGSLTKHIKGVDIIAALKPKQILEMLEKQQLKRRLGDSAAGIDENDARLLKDDASYWADHLPPDYINTAIRNELGEDHLDLLSDRARVLEGFFERAENERGVFEGWGLWVDMPVPNSYVINTGLGVIINRAKAEMAKMEKEGGSLTSVNSNAYHKHILLRSMIISCQAVIDWAHRHAELARNLARSQHDPVRKAELERIANQCDWVPANPPRSFCEAVQSLRFIHLAIKKEQPERPEDIGRLDQMLFPYYQKDLTDGIISRQEAAEILACFWLKTRESEILEAVRSDLRGTPGSMLPHVAIGGRAKDGKDDTNELSWIILEVLRQMRLPEPSVYIRYHDGMSDEFLLYALEINRLLGGGNPCFLNDKLGTERWVTRGVKIEDAVDWWPSGCLGYRLACDERDGSGPHLNQAKIFEIMLNNGFDPRTKKQLGLRTGDVTKFKSIDQFYEAFFKQEDYFANKARQDYFIRRSVSQQIRANSGFGAAMLEDSITKGLGNHEEGGARYLVQRTQRVGERGMTDVVDCLAAIKYLVFDKKKINTSELLDAIKVNWKNKANIHQMCLQAPKYGNNDDYVDDIFKYISLKTEEIMQSRPCPLTGQKPLLFRGAASGHLVHGAVVGALPNGRKAGTPVNDGGTSAMPGMDTKGPTALINSATKQPNMMEYMGIVHNMKFSKTILDSRDKLEKLLGLVKVFFARGGWHIQFNILNAADLLDAKKHPEKWRNLVVRVAGYSAYFVDLPTDLQDEIIARTVHEV